MKCDKLVPKCVNYFILVREKMQVLNLQYFNLRYSLFGGNSPASILHPVKIN
jgi:hypothetical protein